MTKNFDEGGYTPAFIKSRENLRKLTPQTIAEGSLCKYLNGLFIIESFGEIIEISYPEGQIIGQDSNSPYSDNRLLLLNYLSYAKNIPFSDQWVSYRDLPHGNVFYPSIKRNVIDTLGDFFSSCNKEVLSHSLAEAGFTLLPAKADIAVKGFFAPRIPILLYFWEGEEGIPSACQILFNSTISEQMHMEDISALCGIIKTQVISQYTRTISKLPKFTQSVILS